MELHAIDRSERTRIRDAWCELEARARPPYFLSWGWVETWLDALPPAVPVRLYVARRAGAPVAAFFLGAGTRWRHRVVPSRSLYLNQTGIDDYDQITIEYNGWLADGAAPSLAEVAARLPRGWDELHLSALDAAGAPGADLEDESGELRVRIEREVSSPLVDLAQVRGAGDYVGLLGKNTRATIRRSARLYEARGKLALDVADTAGAALATFDELVALHRRAWRDRGQDGAFGPFMRAFHQRLIRTRMAAGEIQLVRVRAGATTIGCLYNFVYRGTVAFYQGGLVYEDDNKLKPGLVCHAEAVRHNAALGHAVYDFLGGDAQYKQSLATGARALVWARVQRRRLRFALEDLARELRDRVREARARS